MKFESPLSNSGLGDGAAERNVTTMVDQTTTTLFNDIYDATNRRVLIYITAKCGSVADIRDIFQETYLEVFQSLRRGVAQVQNPEAFVVAIAKQKLYRHYTALERLKAQRAPDVFPEDTEDGQDATGQLAEDPEIAERLANAQLMAEIRGLLTKQPTQVQKIFHLYYALDVSIPQIAKLLGMSSSNVKNKLYRTLRALRKHYL